jgi:phage shock protein A
MNPDMRIKNMEQAYHRVKNQRDSLREKVAKMEERIKWLESGYDEYSEYLEFENAKEYQEFVNHYLSND